LGNQGIILKKICEILAEALGVKLEEYYKD
jgi:hypothetical protein